MISWNFCQSEIQDAGVWSNSFSKYFKEDCATWCNVRTRGEKTVPWTLSPQCCLNEHMSDRINEVVKYLQDANSYSGGQVHLKEKKEDPNAWHII